MDINDLRNEIDKVDSALLELLLKRLEIVDEIGKFKAKNGITVKNEAREAEILAKISAACPPQYVDSCAEIYKAVFASACVRQSSKRFALIGGRLSHSYSKPLHALLGDYTYDLREVTDNEVKALFEGNEYSGFNVTIPHKLTAYSLCGRLSEEASATGSVNTVIKSGGVLCGYNTDCFGFEFLLDRNEISLAHKKVLILGSGGVSKTVNYVAHKRGAAEVTVVSRSGENAYSSIDKFADYEIIINATPVGMFPDNGTAPVDISAFARCEAVVDLIYNPLKTKLILDAQSRGIKAAGGLLMLVAQGAMARRIFTGKPVNSEEIIEVYNKLLTSKSNIVLIGMPGCGKSSAARMLGSALGREVIDTDEKITALTGMSVEEIFAQKGEGFFRDAESKVIADCGKLSGVVIACGGGSVLKQRNRIALRQNGVIIYLKRPLDRLATVGRPLSADAEALGRLFAQREPIYNDMCDMTIDTERLDIL